MNNTKQDALDRSESLVREWLPEGKLEAGEWRCGGVDGSKGRSMSVNLATGFWNDHATDESGKDLISLLAAINGCDYKTAAQQIDQSVGNHRPTPTQSKPDDWNQITSVPDNAPAPTFAHYKLGKPSSTWTYRNLDGTVYGHVARYDTPDGKTILPQTYRDNGHARDWRWKGFGPNRPLYLVHRLKQDGRVLIVEGEKAADALARMLPHENVISWQGGAKAIKQSDWSPLKSRSVVIWPDNDEPGIDSAKQIRRILGTSARIVTPPTDKPQKWDAADAETDQFNAEQFLADKEVEEAASQGLPFKILGVADDHYHYLPNNGHMVVKITASGHTKQNMMRLAPLQVWEDQFPGGNGVDWDAAVNALINQSQSKRQFDSKVIRGRGCWLEDKNVVFHAGDRLIVNGDTTDIHKFKSKSVYAAKPRLSLYDGAVASADEGKALVELCMALSWRNNIDGFLMAGWLALAPISGVLAWRPHIWMTGPSGTGKTWVFDNIVKDVAGDMVLAVQSNTTEAGIRCSLGSDSMPVIFDEAEAENHTAAARIERVMELARQASSEGSSGIIKGTATGGSITHYVRSMFLFSSIGVSSVKKADTSRISSLELAKTNDPAQFQRVKDLWKASVLTSNFGDKIRARSIKNALVIRQNAEVFSNAAASILGDKRSADQYGTLIAGCYSLVKSTIATETEAREWMEKMDFSSLMPEPSDTDEALCLSYLMGSMISDRAESRTVSSVLVDAVSGETSAMISLRSHGMTVFNGDLYVANTGPQLERIFKESPWGAGKWPSQLARINGAERHPAMRFGPYSRQRCVKISMKSLKGVTGVDGE